MVRLEGSIKRFIGLSTDAKPQAADGLPSGSSFLEQDTGRIYRWSGFEWTVYQSQDEQVILLQGILAKLTELSETLSLATQ